MIQAAQKDSLLHIKLNFHNLTAEQILALIAVGGVVWTALIYLVTPLIDKLYVRQFKRNRMEIQPIISLWFAGNIMIIESNAKAIDELLKRDREISQDLVEDRKETKEMFNNINNKLESISSQVTDNGKETQYLRGVIERNGH